MKTLYFELSIDELDLDFDYHPMQVQKLEQEPLDECMTLSKCEYKGIDISPLLDSEQISELEEWALNERRESKFDI